MQRSTYKELLVCRAWATYGLIDHFTVVCSVTWPLNESEAGVDLVLIQTSLLLSCKCTKLALEQLDLHNKSSETRSTPASLSFKGQVTEQTTVKWSVREKVNPVLGCPRRSKNAVMLCWWSLSGLTLFLEYVGIF